VIDFTLHRLPRYRDVVREQVRAVGLSLRPVALVAAVVLAITTFVMIIDIADGKGAMWFDSDHWMPITIASFLLPFAVWRRDKRFGSAFPWTLPVDRRRLALAKVLGGWVWMTTALAILVVLEKVMAIAAGVAFSRTLPLLIVTGTTATYLLGSALLLGLRHPLRWLFGAGGVLLMVPNVIEALGQNPNGEWRLFAWPGVRWAIYGPYGLQTLLSSSGFFSEVENAGEIWLSMPAFAQWAIATVVCCGGALAALWVAALRHRERRRH
jgi:hypothetical protein